MRIGLLGATGYTGKLVAAELDRRGLDHKLGARSESRLAQIPVSATGKRDLVDATSATSLDAWLADIDALITCVGPFTRLGRPVVEAAVRRGIPYVDSTGEPGFMAQVYADFADAANPIVPACGFDYIPGDLAVAIAEADLGEPVQRIEVGYQVKGGVSRGTATTASEVIGTTPVRPRAGHVTFPDRTYSALLVPWGENLTVARRHPGIPVDVRVAVPALIAHGASFATPALTRAFARVLQPLAARLPEGPPPAKRAAARCRVLATARGATRSTRVLFEGRDMYGMTARFLVEAVQRISGHGALTPAQALDPVAFLDAVSSDTISWRRL